MGDSLWSNATPFFIAHFKTLCCHWTLNLPLSYNDRYITFSHTPPIVRLILFLYNTTTYLLTHPPTHLPHTFIHTKINRCFFSPTASNSHTPTTHTHTYKIRSKIKSTFLSNSPPLKHTHPPHRFIHNTNK